LTLARINATAGDLMKILFITGNKHKAQEAKAILHGHEVVARELDVPEIQSLDPEAIIEAKIAAARKLVKEKDAIILVEDVSFWIGETGLPGPLIKFFYEQLGQQGLVTFARAFTTERATAECNIGVLLPGKRKPAFFKGAVHGKLVDKHGDSKFGFDPVFVPDGHTKTYAEMAPEEKNAISHRRLALEQLETYLERVPRKRP